MNNTSHEINNISNYQIVSRKGRAANLSLLSILIVCFICMISFSVRNFISNRMTLDIYAGDLASIEDEELLAEIHVKKGDNLKKILIEQKISNSDVALIIKSLKNANINIVLKPGDIVSCDYVISAIDGVEDENSDALNYTLRKLHISSPNLRNVMILRENDAFRAEELKAKLVTKYASKTIYMDTTFASSMLNNGVSAKNAQEIINAYSHKVDFQRQIKNGDSIKILTEKIYSEDGKFITNGKVLYASLTLSGKKHDIYFFKNDQNTLGDYYGDTGQSVKRSLLRTPINSSRISSKFGKRQHPVYGFTQMHKGVDFSAPSGTPILAAGDGVVKEIGYRGAYGNMIKIKHNAAITTAYAHASKFASNLKIGSKVKQGQVIAYVGRTGRATGPHCHFEVIVNGKHVNPMSIHTTPGVGLKNKNLDLFNKNKSKIQALLAKTELMEEITLSEAEATNMRIAH